VRLVTAGATGCKTVCLMMLRLKGDGHADRARGRLGGAFAMGYLVVRPHGAYFGDNEALGDTAAARASLPVSVPGLFGLSRVIREPVGVFDRLHFPTSSVDDTVFELLPLLEDTTKRLAPERRTIVVTGRSVTVKDAYVALSARVAEVARCGARFTSAEELRGLPDARLFPDIGVVPWRPSRNRGLCQGSGAGPCTCRDGRAAQATFSYADAGGSTDLRAIRAAADAVRSLYPTWCATCCAAVCEGTTRFPVDVRNTVCEGPGGGAPCLKNGGCGARPHSALVPYAGAPADLDSFKRAARQAHARGDRDDLVATHCEECGRRAAALAGGVVCIPLRTDTCVGTGGASCPRTSNASFVVVATEGATGAALGARVRTIRATPGLHRTHCARCGAAEARTRGSFVCVRLTGRFCQGPSADSPCPGKGGLGYMASFDLADAGGSGDGAEICDAFFAARRGGRRRFCKGCAIKAATAKKFVISTGALRLSKDEAAKVIMSAWTVAGPPLADWGKGIGLLMNDGLGQRMLNEEVAKFQERAADLAAAPAPAAAPAATPATTLQAAQSNATPATARAQPVDVSAPAPAPDFLPWRPSARKKRARSPSPSQPAYGAMPRPSLGSWLRRRRPRSWIG